MTQWTFLMMMALGCFLVSMYARFNDTSVI